MSFKKNVLSVVFSTLFILLCAYLIRLPQDVLVYGLFVWITGSVVSLAVEDLMWKSMNNKPALTWEYFVGFALVLLGALAFLCTIQTVTAMQFAARCCGAVFFGMLGGIWFYGPYKNSVMDAEEIEQHRWGKAVEKIAKAKTERDKAKIASERLRYRLIGDSIAGDLDFDRPLAFYEGECMTLDEARELKPEDTEDPIYEIQARAERYITGLVKEGE